MTDNKKTPESVAADPGADAKASQNSTNSIAHADDKSKPLPSYYLVIPASIAFDAELKPNAKLLYGMISALTRAEGYCWASNAYLAELTGLTEGNVGRLIAQLEERGHIAREVVRDGETNAVTGRKIWLYQSAAAHVIPPCKNAEGSLQKSGDPPCKKAGRINILDNTIPPISPKVDVEQPEPVDVLFERFWKRYPARTIDGVARKGSKQQARRRWRGLKVTVKRYEEIMAALERYITSPEVQRGYAVDASRWLNERRWEDEPLTTQDLGLPSSIGAIPADWTEEIPGGFWNG